MPEARLALVTGAAQGLGRAVAMALHQAGWRVAALDVNEGALAYLEMDAPGLRTWTVDLANADATRTTLDEVREAMGHVSYLVHNAAILIEEPFETVTWARWTATVDVGLQAAYLLTQAMWQDCLAENWGRIVYVSSRSGIVGFANEVPYCAAKHGLEGMMKALALESEGTGVAVSTITPGMYMHTPMSERNYPPEAKAQWVEPSELAPAFVHLGTVPDARYSGQRLDAWQISQELAHGS